MTINNEIKYQTLIETAPDAIFIADMESGRILETNERAQELLGYSESELTDRPIKTIHPEEKTEQYLGKFQEAVEQESIQFSKFEDGTQVYLVTKNGERIPVDICTTVVEGSTGPVLFGVARDISELKQYEQDIEQLAGELAVVNRIVRHDIRNDMAVILGWLEQLESEVDGTSQEIFERLFRKSQSVVELTDNVRDYVEMIEGDTDAHLESILISDIIETEVAAIEQGFDEVEIVVSDVPKEPVIANSMLASVFRNLFHNAIHHNDKSVPKITVTTENREDSFVIHVADNGPGIADDRKSEIFGKGQKGLESSGTGIGLYLIGELIEMFGGDVWMRDNDPEGTIFSVELQKPE